MHAVANKTKNSNVSFASNSVYQKQRVNNSAFQFNDNRPEAIIQRKLQAMANQSAPIMQLKVLQKKTNDDLLQKKSSIQLNQKVLQPKYKLKSYLAWNNWKVGRSQNAGIINQGFYQKDNDYVEVHYHVNGKTLQKNEFISFTATFMEYDQRFKNALPARYHYNIGEDGSGQWDKTPLGEWRDKAEKNATNTLNNFIEDEGDYEIISK
jgi:hypothetical protein